VRLFAKQGAKTIHHFAHEGDSNRKGGLQTTFHLAVKSILTEERRMMLPALEVVEIARDELGRSQAGCRATPSKAVAFDRVCEEVRFGGFDPDTLAELGGPGSVDRGRSSSRRRRCQAHQGQDGGSCMHGGPPLGHASRMAIGIVECNPC